VAAGFATIFEPIRSARMPAIHDFQLQVLLERFDKRRTRESGGTARTHMTSRSEDVILIACSALEPSAEQRDRLVSVCRRGEIDWDLVYSAAVTHKVAPLIYQNLKLFEPLIGSIPEHIEAGFMQVSRRNGVRNRIVADGIADIAGYFDRLSHDILLLKHTAYHLRLKPLYDMTMSDDFDLVVRPRAEAAEIQGAPYLWSSHSIPDATWKVIVELMESNDPRLRLLHLEVDNRLHHDVVWNGVIPIDFRRIWTDANVHQIKGKSVYVPDIHDLIVISAVNIFRKPFLRLRNILEIHELIRSEKKLDWEALSAKVRSYQCGSLVYSALYATRAILGTDIRDADIKALKPPTFRSLGLAFVNRRISPTARHAKASLSDRSRGSRRGMSDLARRLFALDFRQIIRFFWLRIILRRVAGVIRY
jgi:Uncharacterised nucleotidyltransferase